MFICPCCLKEIAIENLCDVSQHLKEHRANGDPHSMPLHCYQCGRDYQNPSSFKKHFARFHHDSILPQTTEPESPPLHENLHNFHEEARSEETYVNAYEKDTEIFFLDLFCRSSMPRSEISNIFGWFSRFIKTLETEVSDLIEGELTFSKETVMKEILKAREACESFSTPYKMIRWCECQPEFVTPIEIELGVRSDAQLHGNRVRSIQKRNSAYYVPFQGTFATVLKNKSFSASLLSESRKPPAARGYYCSFKDGTNCQSHPLFNDPEKISLKLQLYYDDIATTNPLRGHSWKHKLSMFYFTFIDMPRQFQTMSNIHLLAVANTADLKQGGFAKLLNRIMDDVLTLEKQGISVEIAGLGNNQVYASIAQCTGDCLGLNQLFGLIENFSSGHFCVFCYASKEDIQILFLESDFELRTTESHDEDVAALESGKQVHVRGVKSQSSLNRSFIFHTTKNKTFDSMHVLLEGVVPYETSCVLFIFINVLKIITLDELNNRMRDLFNTLEVNKSNSPAVITEIKPPGLGMAPKLTAVEMLSFFRYLPLILGDHIDRCDAHWLFFLKLQEIVDIVLGNCHNELILQYFQREYATHLKVFKMLFPYLPIKPKQHILIHFPTAVRANGPISDASCLIYEMRHNAVKHCAHVRHNYVNIAKSVAYQFQYSALRTNKPDLLCSDEFKKTHKLEPVSLNSFPGGETVATVLQISIKSIVYCSLKFSYCGRRYSQGNVVVIGKQNSELEFGEIKKIVWQESRPILVVEHLHTLGFEPHFHAYAVSNSDCPVFSCLSVNDLFDFHPLDKISKSGYSHDFVRLNYHVM